MEEMGLENTLLGVDLVKDQTLIAQDLTAVQLLEHTQGQKTKLVITLIGGQGHNFGRGNQRLSPALIRAIGTNNIIVIATKTKLQALNGRPLICDTGDSSLDDELTGYIKVTCGDIRTPTLTWTNCIICLSLNIVSIFGFFRFVIIIY